MRSVQFFLLGVLAYALFQMILSWAKKKWKNTSIAAKNAAREISNLNIFVMDDPYYKDDMLVLKLGTRAPSLEPLYELSILVQFSADHPDWDMIKRVSKSDKIHFISVDRPQNNMSDNQISAYLKVMQITY